MNYVSEIHKIGKCEPRVSYPNHIKFTLTYEGHGMQELKGLCPQVFCESSATEGTSENKNDWGDIDTGLVMIIKYTYYRVINYSTK